MKKVVAVDLWSGGASSSMGHWPSVQRFEPVPKRLKRESVLEISTGEFLGRGNFMSVYVCGNDSEKVVKKVSPREGSKPLSEAYLLRSFSEELAVRRAGISCLPILNTPEEARATRVLIMPRIPQDSFLSKQGLDKLTISHLLFTLFSKVIASFSLADQIFFVPDFNVDNLVVSLHWRSDPGKNDVDKLLCSVKVSDTVSNLDWGEGFEFAAHMKKIFTDGELPFDSKMFSQLVAITQNAMKEISAFITLGDLDSKALSSAQFKLTACRDIAENFELSM